jgi:hypothetical protein
MIASDHAPSSLGLLHPLSQNRIDFCGECLMTSKIGLRPGKREPGERQANLAEMQGSPACPVVTLAGLK